MKPEAKEAGDDRLASAIRVIANALVWGQASRFDETYVAQDRSRHKPLETQEIPGPWNWPPQASSVSPVVACC
jgi:hypothetical protein